MTWDRCDTKQVSLFNDVHWTLRTGTVSGIASLNSSNPQIKTISEMEEEMIKDPIWVEKRIERLFYFIDRNYVQDGGHTLYNTKIKHSIDHLALWNEDFGSFFMNSRTISKFISFTANLGRPERSSSFKSSFDTFRQLFYRV